MRDIECRKGEEGPLGQREEVVPNFLDGGPDLKFPGSLLSTWDGESNHSALLDLNFTSNNASSITHSFTN